LRLRHREDAELGEADEAIQTMDCFGFPFDELRVNLAITQY
jgi:hypothetical protein